MPLYELILISRAFSASNTTNLCKTLANSIYSKGGNVRDCTVLGDRIMSNRVRGGDGQRHFVGRYLKILFDGNPQLKDQIERETRINEETIRIKTFKVKDFFNDALTFQKAVAQDSIIYNQRTVDRDYLQSLKQFAVNKKP